MNRESTHPVVSIFLLHGVRVEESENGAGLRFPVLFVDFTEQQQRHKHIQVVEVTQLPDAEGFPLQRERAQSQMEQYASFPTRPEILRFVLDYFNAVISYMSHLSTKVYISRWEV